MTFDELHLNASEQELAQLREVWDQLGALPREQPSAALRARFYQRLHALEKPKRSFAWKWAWVQMAAGVLLFVLGMTAARFRPNSELGQMREKVALSMLDQESATSRLEGVEWSSRVEKPGGELRLALMRTLNRDPNVNVRLASLDALEKFSEEPEVRRALVSSIALQDSPLVQIALIDAVVHMHDHDAAMQLRRVTANTEMNATVRQRAQWGLQKLGL